MAPSLRASSLGRLVSRVLPALAPLALVLSLAAPLPKDAGAAPADSPRDTLSGESALWSVTAFGGVHDDSRLWEILTFRGHDFESSYLAGVAVTREVGASFDRLTWELEGSLFRHFGNQSHLEGNLALLARWRRFPWDSFVDTSVALGQGISVAAERPEIERPDAQEVLHYTAVEAEFAPPSDSRWSVVGRIHHRSGVFGLYGTRGGSNFHTLGVRLHF